MTTATITRQELAEAIDGRSVVVLEALPSSYFEQGHLPGARNLPLDALDQIAPELVPDEDTPIVTYCSNEQCNNSTIAAERLQELGYRNVRKFPGGKQEWVEAGLPLERAAERDAPGAVAGRA